MKIHRLLGLGEIPSLMLGAGHPNRKGSVSFNRGLRYAHPNPPPMYLKASFFCNPPSAPRIADQATHHHFDPAINCTTTRCCMPTPRCKRQKLLRVQ